jgi:hypothetical protein
MTSLEFSPQAAGISAARQAQDGAAPATGADAASGDWAICCSGGGIRSAAYCLGALQSLDSDGLYDAAEFEAYHALGEATMLAAAQNCRPPLRCPVPAGQGGPSAPHSPVPAGEGNPPTPRQLGNGSGT